MPRHQSEIAQSPRPRIWGLPKNIFFLGLTSLFNDFSSEMVFSVFPAFFTTVLKAGARSLGLVDGIAEGLSNLFKIFSGNVSDRLQRRKALVVAGYVLSVLTRPFYVFVSAVGGALGLRVLDRVGKGLRDAPRDAIISLSTPKEELGRSFGYHRAMDTLGSILGPLVAYLILRFYPLHFNAVFLTAFVVVGTHSYGPGLSDISLVHIIRTAFGPAGAIVAGIAALFICLAPAIAYIGAASRLACSLATSGFAPRLLAWRSAKYLTPVGGLLFLAVCFTILLIVFSTRLVSLTTLIQIPSGTARSHASSVANAPSRSVAWARCQSSGPTGVRTAGAKKMATAWWMARRFH